MTFPLLFIINSTLYTTERGFMAFIKGNNEYQSRKRTKIYLKITPQILAKARGISVGGIHQAIYRGKFDPRDLESIAKYILKERRKNG